MATKAELEAELTNLRDELAQMRASRTAADAAPKQEADASIGDEPGATAPEQPADMFDETRIKEIVADFEDLAAKHPVMTLVGVFVAGIVVGRLLSR